MQVCARPVFDLAQLITFSGTRCRTVVVCLCIAVGVFDLPQVIILPEGISHLVFCLHDTISIVTAAAGLDDGKPKSILILQLISIFFILIEIMLCPVLIDINVWIITDSGFLQLLHRAQSPAVTAEPFCTCLAQVIYVADTGRKDASACLGIRMNPDDISCIVIGITAAGTSRRLFMVALIILKTADIAVIDHTAGILGSRNLVTAA